MMRRLINLTLSLLCLVGLLSGVAQADTGPCNPEGGTVSASYDYGNNTITEPDQNAVGTIIPAIVLQAPSGSINIVCSCTGGPYQWLWLWGDTTLPLEETINGLNYFGVPGNEYLQVALESNTSGGTYYSFPFDGKHNYSATKAYKCGASNAIAIGSTHTGSMLRVTLRIKKSFIGSSYLASTYVGSTYWTIGDVAAPSHGSIAAVDMYISGSVTVPQNCTVNAGTQIVVPLGDIFSGDFTTAGDKAKNYTPKTFNVPVECNSVNAYAQLSLRVQGTPSSSQPQALETGNPDVGIVIADSDGKVLAPNDATTSTHFTLDASSKANVSLQTYPISTTGKAPGEGTFSSLALLRVDFD
ncbi:MAG: fimbrial protein [Scandinavium sp.]|uniref:fimbrial protein n=1 Tax=Scandinavium sp. TaxID=2830653 RepID=UPI003F3CD63E